MTAMQRKPPQGSDGGNLLWHYTIGHWLRLIVADGIIKTATAGVPEGERPIVWFSKNPHWEQTANKALPRVDGHIVCPNMEQTAAHSGLGRIAVCPETAPYDWNALKELSGMTSKWAAALYKTAIAEGSRPSEWRGAFEPVPRSKWIGVESMQDGKWVPLPREDWVAARPRLSLGSSGAYTAS